MNRFSLEAVVECRTFQPLHFALGDTFLGNAAKQDRDPTRPPTEHCHDRERTGLFATVTQATCCLNATFRALSTSLSSRKGNNSIDLLNSAKSTRAEPDQSSPPHNSNLLDLPNARLNPGQNARLPAVGTTRLLLLSHELNGPVKKGELRNRAFGKATTTHKQAEQR